LGALIWMTPTPEMVIPPLASTIAASGRRIEDRDLMSVDGPDGPHVLVVCRGLICIAPETSNDIGMVEPTLVECDQDLIAGLRHEIGSGDRRPAAELARSHPGKLRQEAGARRVDVPDDAPCHAIHGVFASGSIAVPPFQ
jgi:hypothetical protein